MKKNRTGREALRKLPLLAACILGFGCILWLSHSMRQKEQGMLPEQTEREEYASGGAGAEADAETSVPESGTQEGADSAGLSVTLRGGGKESGQEEAEEKGDAAPDMPEEIPVDADYGEPERQDVAPEDDFPYVQPLQKQGAPKQEAGQ